MDTSEIPIQNEDILKQFDLPERKSKINTILKLKDSAPVYCVCHSTDISRFMICCEKCDEWYHGDCIGVEESDAKFIKKWFCPDCLENYGLKVIYRKKGSSMKKSVSKDHLLKSHNKKSKECPKPVFSRCGQCSNCLQNEECGNKDHSFVHKIWPSKRAKFESSETSSSVRCNSKENDSHHTSSKLSTMTDKQCLGPQCVKKARKDSKYCSDDCGLALAKLRILEILPHRISEQGKYPPVAEDFDQKKLKHIRRKKEVVKNKLKQLDHKEKRLLSLIARAKCVPVIETREEPVDDENKMYCVTCGWDIPIKSAVKHMELCFRKFEAQSVLVSSYKSPTNYNILCEHFDPSKKTYCKRLRYICPDHFKPQKSKDVEVCGCPIIKTMSKNIFSGAEKYCQLEKQKCDLHYHWDILARADLDLDRFREWNKLTVLVEEEAVILKQMTNRHGLLGLLLHSTSAA